MDIRTEFLFEFEEKDWIVSSVTPETKFAFVGRARKRTENDIVVHIVEIDRVDLIGAGGLRVWIQVEMALKFRQKSRNILNRDEIFVFDEAEIRLGVHWTNSFPRRRGRPP